MTGLAEAGARLLGGVLASARPLHGGDLSGVALIDLRDGRRAVVKSGPAPRGEAGMLGALAAAGMSVPKVLAVDDTILVMEFLEADGRPAQAWPEIGAALARLHAVTGPCYGWAEDYAFGPVAIENAWCKTWPDFYARRRLLTHQPYLPPSLAKRVETLAADMANRLPGTPPAALLHGDFWGGNMLVSGRAVTAFIDPACYYGHAEIDLAMLGLFDRPSSAFIDSYGRLEPGYADRQLIYRLWPALVHLRLFGAGYRGLVETLLHQAGV